MRQWQQHEIARVIAMAHLGKSARQIGVSIDRTTAAVHYIAGHMGIKLTGRRQAKLNAPSSAIQAQSESGLHARQP